MSDELMTFQAINGVNIPVDEFRRFSLTAFHAASGEGKSKQPSNWLRLDSTKKLIAEVTEAAAMNIQPVRVTCGGCKDRGTFAVKPIVVAYAMWVSVGFYLKVVSSFDLMIGVNGLTEEGLS
jgi:hypothetical protein